VHRRGALDVDLFPFHELTVGGPELHRSFLIARLQQFSQPEEAVSRPAANGRIVNLMG
jgi:hypothetical protein